MSNPINKRAKDSNRCLPPKHILMANKYRKRCPTSDVIKDLQINITMRYNCTLTGMANTQSADITRWLMKMWSGRNSRSLPLGMQMAPLLWKTVYWFLTKLNSLTTQSSNCPPRYLPKWVESLCPHKHLHMDIFSGFIHNCQKLEAPKIPFNRWMITLWYIHTMKYYAVIKRNEAWKDIAKWKEPVGKNYTLYDSNNTSF